MASDTNTVSIAPMPTTPIIKPDLIDKIAGFIDGHNAKKNETKKPIFASEIKDAKPDITIVGKQKKYNNLTDENSRTVGIGEIIESDKTGSTPPVAQKATSPSPVIPAAPKVAQASTPPPPVIPAAPEVAQASTPPPAIVENVFNPDSIEEYSVDGEGDNIKDPDIEETENISKSGFGGLTAQNYYPLKVLYDDPLKGLPPINSLGNSVPVEPYEAAPPDGTQDIAESVYDLAWNKAVKAYNDGEITYDDLIAAKNKLINDAEENQIQEKIGKSTNKQINTVTNFLNSDTNKTFAIEDFDKDPKIKGAITATQEIPEVGLSKTVKILKDGTQIEMDEDSKKSTFTSALLGTRGGMGTVIVGGVEVVGGIVGCFTGVAAPVGIAAIVDGGRRIYNGFTKGQAYSATIKPPKGEPVKVESNYKDKFNEELYKKMGLIK